MLKFAFLLLTVFLMSGCCELFGICTSVNVHTSISSPEKFAEVDPNIGPGLSLADIQESPQAGLTPAGTIVSNPPYLPPDN
jgi:hypothetical protein